MHAFIIKSVNYLILNHYSYFHIWYFTKLVAQQQVTDKTEKIINRTLENNQKVTQPQIAVTVIGSG